MKSEGNAQTAMSPTSSVDVGFVATQRRKGIRIIHFVSDAGKISLGMTRLQ